MTKILAIACAAALSAATFASASELTAPVGVSQNEAGFGAGITSTTTLTAGAIVVGGALIVDGADGSKSSSTTTTSASE